MRRWTEEEDALLRELATAGKSGKQIGLRIGRPTTSTFRRAMRLGISFQGGKKDRSQWSHDNENHGVVARMMLLTRKF